jgi:3,4-dihydroxy 2-butanone 4-phosphate synthase/GTP cyclohydrolase II
VIEVTEVARLVLPLPEGEFELRAFDVASGVTYLALSKGDVADGRPVLVRLHSECLTGDVLGSLRCDCGVQLRAALRIVAAEGRGAVVYATGQEGRGIGLVNKLKAYMLQDGGADTVDANVALGLPVDARRYDEAAAVLRALGVGPIRLLSNNPAKREGLEAAGVPVAEIVPLATAAHARNLGYLRTKRERMDHRAPTGIALDGSPNEVPDVTALLGDPIPSPDRPYVVLKFAQTLDGRVASSTGDSKWISSEDERRVTHALRAACDAVLVGVGTVVADDPQLTVRMVPGASPTRVVLDPLLRIPLDARVLSGGPTTVVFAGHGAPADHGWAIRARGAAVRLVDGDDHGLQLTEVLRVLRGEGMRTLLVEGGARVITSFLAAGLVDRVVVSIAPLILGAGTDSVGDLGAARIGDALRLARRRVHRAGDDVIVAGDLVPARSASEASRSIERSLSAG